MKNRFIFLSFIILLITHIQAQIVTDGNGTKYTLQDLATAYPEAVTCTDPGVYHLHENLTLSANDTLFLDESLQQLVLHNELTITIQGALTSAERTDLLTVTSERENAESTSYEWRLEEGSVGLLQHILFEDGKDIFLTDGEFTLRHCEFTGFAESAVRLMNCNPVITGCHFHDNHAAAIQSPANASSSPIITNNTLYNNVLDNTNNPQINLGTGGTDTIVITGNRIEGVASTMSGGIAISNLVGAEQVTQVLLSGNTITHNRYGYTQTGTNISAEILDNIITDNNLETDPMNGGSGISIYGYDTTCYAKIRRNLIAGNLWGVTAVYRYQIDMGTANDWGRNVLYDNANNNELYAFAMSQYSTLDVTAIGNYWGNNDTAFAESVILHQHDQSNLGLVEFDPILPLYPTVEGVEFYNVPDYSYEIDTPNIFVLGSCVLPIDATLEEIILHVPLGVTYTPILDTAEWDDETLEFYNITRKVYYSVSTPHHDTAIWILNFGWYISVKDNPNSFTLYPNPVSSGQLNLQNDAAAPIDIEVYDMSGKRVYRGHSQDQYTSINVSNWKRGVYMVRIKEGQNIHTRKVVVQ
ncbi:MAG: T9SS type A sorting domain-containing protein [Bacteroidales bacterium]|nr:T9SS type A sorting domain-containing protein [Bacteroidales bacterium]